MADDLKQEVYPGGPTKEQVQQWKQTHGDVYATNFGSPERPDYYFWRTLTRIEFKTMVKDQAKSEDSLWQEERLVERCLLWPEFDLQTLYATKAGIPSVLADEIMAKSGFAPTQESLSVEELGL